MRHSAVPRWLFRYLLVLLSSLCTIQSRGQTGGARDPWLPMKTLLGTWDGGDGSAAQGRSTFTFATDLQQAILVRKSHGEYPATANRPAFSHDDLTIVYRDANGAFRADYFDNEHHVIRYSVSADSARITFLSDTTAPGPAFRLTYRSAGVDSLFITFAIAPPTSPRQFATYLEGGARKRH